MAEKSMESNTSASSSPKHEDRQTGNWWDSWITSAKSKSVEVYSMVKKDLDEIGTAVKSEASHVFTTTSTAIGKTLKLDEPESPANVMKKSFSTFIGQVHTVLNPEPDDEEDTEVILSSGDTTMLSTYKKELEALQRLDATFIVSAESPELSVWLESKEPLSDRALLSRLANSALLAAQYERLVPDAVTHQQFWERYLYRVDLLQDKLASAARRQPDAVTNDPVLAHLPLSSQPADLVVQESPKMTLSRDDVITPEPEVPVLNDNVITWEEEDFANELELSEEQQTLLLEEYEKEIATKKLTKQTSTKDIANNNQKNKSTATKTGRNKPTIDKVNKPSKNKNERKKAGKADVCGNNLVEDYFAEKETKDDASANSDESWEKEFEIEEVKA